MIRFRLVTVFVVLARCLVVFRLVPGTPILLPLLALTASVGGEECLKRIC